MLNMDDSVESYVTHYHPRPGRTRMVSCGAIMSKIHDRLAFVTGAVRPAG